MRSFKRPKWWTPTHIALELPTYSWHIRSENTTLLTEGVTAMNMPPAYNPSSTANHWPYTNWSIVLPCMRLISQGYYTALWSSFQSFNLLCLPPLPVCTVIVLIHTSHVLSPTHFPCPFPVVCTYVTMPCTCPTTDKGLSQTEESVKWMLYKAYILYIIQI